MYLRVISNITIQQKPSNGWPGRNGSINLDFLTEYEATDSWRDLTNKATLIIPKNLYYRDVNKALKPLFGTNVNAGGFSTNTPLFLRGDKVSIVTGYKYYNKAHREIEDTSTQFTGFITKVSARTPIVMELEDNMWLLKQLPVPTHTFSGNDTLEDILKFITKGTGFTINSLTKTTFGSFTIGNETAAQVLHRLQKTYGFEFYFRGDELRGGVLIYVEAEAANEIFHFQKNIISDDLEYSRKDDIVLSAVAYNTITVNNGKCKDGTDKTKHNRIEVLVTLKGNQAPGELPYTSKIIEKGHVPENQEGERRTFFFPGATTPQELASLAYEKLKQYYYIGFKGTFETFGIPMIRPGDNVTLIDNILPERNGTYKVKSVGRRGGHDIGLKQTIELDYKI